LVDASSETEVLCGTMASKCNNCSKTRAQPQSRIASAEFDHIPVHFQHCSAFDITAPQCSTAVAAAGCSRLVGPVQEVWGGVGMCVALLGDKPSLARNESEDSVCQEIFTVEYFQNYQSPRGCKIHNHALKYFRHDAEATGCSAVIFDNTNPAKMKEMVLGPLTEFNFIGEPTIDWHWQELVARLDDKSLAQVVEGQCMDPNRSRGLVSCRLQKTDRYDHKRHYAQEQQGVRPATRIHTEDQLMIWDFVLVRANGTEVWLHPNYTSTKVECLEPCGPDVPGCPQPQDPDVPKSGLGGTSGPGIYNFYKNKNLKTLLHFKANSPKGEGKGKSAVPCA